MYIVVHGIVNCEIIFDSKVGMSVNSRRLTDSLYRLILSHAHTFVLPMIFPQSRKQNLCFSLLDINAVKFGFATSWPYPLMSS